MTGKKRAYVFQGPGLRRDASLDATLKALGFEIHHPFLIPAQASSLDMKPGRDDLILLRGGWDMLPEEILYSRQLGAKVAGIGKVVRALPAEERPNVIGVGRWALALLFAEWSKLSSAQATQLNWTAIPEELRGPWIDAKFGPSSYSARLLGRAVPELAAPDFEAQLLTETRQPVGWRSESFLNLFFADPLALSDGSQLEGFGYENHENLNNNTTFLRHLLGARGAGGI